MKVLVSGISGMLGSNIAYRNRKRWVTVGTYLHHPVDWDWVECRQCDMVDAEQVSALVKSTNPDVVIHCVGDTNMDRQENDPARARRINVQTTANVIAALKGCAAKLVYISTDAVYPGTAGPYAEGGEVRPLSVYGKTKLEAEKMANEVGGLCLRTNFYGWSVQDKLGLAEWFMSSLQHRERAKGFRDIWFSGMYTMDFADVLMACLDADLEGIYNCASRDGWTKLRFGQEIAVGIGLDEGVVESVDSSTVQLVAPRGKDMRLDVTAIELALGRRLPTMKEGIDAFMADYAAGLKLRAIGCRRELSAMERQQNG